METIFAVFFPFPFCPAGAEAEAAEA